MRFFEDLGARVQARWRRVDFDAPAFADIALAALAETPPCASVTVDDIVRWVTTAAALPLQPNLYSKFGEPPLTVFCAERFYIEVLFWLDGTTAIHQHSFSGAFHVLAGASIHSEYAFHTTEPVNPRLKFGELQLTSTELLQAGASRKIEADDRFIHALFHLDRPSCTVVIRTYLEPGAPQYQYFRPYLARDPFLKPVALRKASELLAWQHRHDRAGYARSVAELVAHADLDGALEALFHDAALSRWRSVPDEIAGQLRRRFPAFAARIVEVLAEEVRQNQILGLRASLKDPEQRLFLALLSNVPRRAMLEMIAQRYPGREPAAVLLAWIGGLANQLSPDGARQLDPLSREVVALVLQGTKLERIPGLLARNRESRWSPAEVLAACACIRRSPLLASLQP